jgi:hypothetical protein
MLASRDAPARFAPAQAGREPKYVAYVGFETGRPEIFIRTYPDGERKWRVSRDGGLQPTWRADGKELFFLALDGMLMAAQIGGADSDLRISPPVPLFSDGCSRSARHPRYLGPRLHSGPGRQPIPRE